ncbi:MFS transporter [Amycolatopsis sp. NPDC050768]|uniref:MFS transporter n=1 Tax=Amycolatopsis sp. NPDC050768 TaxID=3154839 RepID=UPI0033CDECE6
MEISSGRRVAALSSLVVAVSVVLLGSTILNVALPEMTQALALTNVGQQWVLNSYTLTFAGFLLIAGTVGDRFGLRRTLLVGLAGFIVVTALASLPTTVGFVIAMRALMGVFAAAIMPTTLAIILRLYPTQKRAGAIVVWAAASGISISAGPLAGGLMLSAGLWWGSVLVLVGVLALIALLASLIVVPRLPASGNGELRFLPVVLSIAGIGLLVLGVLDGGQTSDWLGFTTLCPVVVGLALLAVLIVSEGRRDDALADVRLFRDRGFAMSVLALSVAALVVFGAMYLLTFYLQVARGYTPFQTGLLFIPMSAGLVIGAPISRRLVERLGTGPTIAAGLLLITVAMTVIAFYSMTTSVVLILSVFLALALGFALVLSPGTTAAMSTVPGSRVGAGSALLNTARQVSSALGVAVLGSLLWSAYGSGVGPALATLPTGEQGDARQSLSGTLAVLHDHTGITAARSAFLSALHLTSLVAGGVALVCAVLVGVTASLGHTRAAAVPS